MRRGAMPAPSPSAPLTTHALHGSSRAAAHAPAAQMLVLEPSVHMLDMLGNMKLDKHTRHKLHNQLNRTQAQVNAFAAPS